ncbi:MAG TPA: YebC/PmpR family DNA-binding transcriptional regulator [Nevskiaceae bacterium]|nr:YebC/PmpR family DNA-binding transcriptional regulator [Nevskiaceae bacterium]
MGRGPSIEGRKNAEDAKRAKVFTKLIREITVAARSGGGDPAGNPRLRLCMDKALAANMPKDTLNRAIKRGTGEGSTEAIEEIRYEGYAPGGVALIVDCMTDNPTRTVADVRHAFSKHGGHLGTAGSVAYLFSRRGDIAIDTRGDAGLPEKIMEVAIEAGADDVIDEAGYTEVLTAPENFEAVKQALEKAGLKPYRADIALRPSTRVAVGGETAQAVGKLIEVLEDLDDVQNVYTNADLPE